MNKTKGNSWQIREHKEDKMKKKCGHFFLRGHIKKESFKLVGYPECFDKPMGKRKEVKPTLVNKSNTNNNKVGMNAAKQNNDTSKIHLLITPMIKVVQATTLILA